MVITHSSLSNKPHEILKDIAEVCGEHVFSDRTRMQGILADVTQNKPIRKIILLALEDNIHGKLINNASRNIKIESVKHNFAKQNLLYQETAYYIVDSFAYALKISNNIDLSKYKDDWFIEISVIHPFPESPTTLIPKVEEGGFKGFFSFIKKQTLTISLLLIVIIGTILAFYFKNLPPPPTITKKTIETTDLIGYYSAEQTFGNTHQSASAQIINIDGILNLRFAIANYPPQVMPIKVDIKNLKVETEHLGAGEIIFDQELNEIELILKRDSNIWVLRK
jgi:hypothetical protein